MVGEVIVGVYVCGDECWEDGLGMSEDGDLEERELEGIASVRFLGGTRKMELHYPSLTPHQNYASSIPYHFHSFVHPSPH